jgi:GT2 family glycosyltransferase
LRGLAPEAEIIRNAGNDGFAKGNNEAMKIAMEQGYDYLFLVNMDTVVDPSCVSALVSAAESDCQAGALQARLMLWPDKDKVNSLGNVTHFLGFGYCLGYGEKYVSSVAAPIAYPSGAAVLLRSSALREVGLFDEEFWMYNEDQDLGWRLWLAGWRCVLVPEAVVWHKYEFSRSISKYYWMDRNRLIVIFKNYRLPTLLLVLPALLAMELGLLLFAWRGGWLKEKKMVYKYFIHLANWRKILDKRRVVQKTRKIKDSDIFPCFSGKIWYQEISSPALVFANAVFSLYWKIIRYIVRW